MGQILPDVHRVNVLGDVVAIELSIRGTFLVPFENTRWRDPADGARLDIPTADFWVCARRQDPDVQLPYRYDHHVRTPGRTAGLRLGSRGVRAKTIRPTDKGAAAQQPHPLGRVTQGSDGLLS